MLQYARFRAAGVHLAERHAHGQSFLMRSARLPEALRKVPLANAEAAYDPAVLGAALGGLLRTPPPIDLTHMATPRVTVGERLARPARSAAARHVLASTRRSRTPTASRSASPSSRCSSSTSAARPRGSRTSRSAPITVRAERAARGVAAA